MIFCAVHGAFCHRSHFHFLSRKKKNARLFSGTKYLHARLWRGDLAGAAAGDG
jgi:hypothetical protein